MSELPKGWARERLERLIQARSERVLPSNNPNAPYIGLEHVQAHTNKILGTVPASTMSSSSARFEAGDVLYGRMRPYLNKVVRPKFAGLASAEFIIFPESEVFDSSFLLNRISSSDFVEFACSQYEGDRPRVKFDALGKFAIDLPPRDEQTRIVAKLEELLSDLDAGVTELKAAQKKLTQYRQSLLKASVEGALTAEWRAQHTPSENGAELLQRILTVRRARWEAKQLAKFKEQGKPPPKDWQKKYPEPVQPDTKGLSKLPEGWVWASVDQCSLDESAITDGPFGSNLKSSHYQDSGPRVIRLQNIGDGVFYDAKAHISESHYAELLKHSVQEDDLVIAMLGEVLPRACMIPGGVTPAIVKADCARVRVNKALIKPTILMSQLNSKPVRNAVVKFVKGIGRPRVNLGHIRAIPIALCSVDEQLQMEALLSDAQQSIDRQNEALELSFKQSTAQRQNILRAAFAGQLVPQDPDDEPASALLERIRAERAERDKQPKIRKVRKTKQPKEVAAMMSKLIDVLAEAGDWVPAQEAFSRCGVVDGTPTVRIEELYAELRQLHVVEQRVQVKPATDEHGRKTGDLLKLIAN